MEMKIYEKRILCALKAIQISYHILFEQKNEQVGKKPKDRPRSKDFTVPEKKTFFI